MANTGASGTCAGCGARYSLPSEERVYRCKRCGGEVRATSERPASGPGGLEACPRCQAIVPEGSRFCPECGTAIGPAREERARASAREERLLAAQDIRRAQRTVRIVRWLFGLDAAVYLILTALALLALASPQVGQEALLVVVVFALLSTAALSAVILAPLHPFACAVTLAALHSLGALREITQGDVPVVHIGVSLLLWGFVAPTVRVSRLLRAHPDLFASRKLLGLTTATGLDYEHLRARAARRAWLRVASACLLVLGLTGLIAGVRWSHRPTSPLAVLAEFVIAWNSESATGVARLASADERTGLQERLVSAAIRRRWPSPWPRLEAPREIPFELGATTYEHVFRVRGLGGGDELLTRWQDEGSGWLLARLDLPPPPIEAELGALREAWNRGDAAAMAALARETSRAAMQRQFENLARVRDWPQGFPSIRTHEVTSSEPARARVVFATDAGELRTSWRLDEEDRWYLSSLDPP